MSDGKLRPMVSFKKVIFIFIVFNLCSFYFQALASSPLFEKGYQEFNKKNYQKSLIIFNKLTKEDRNNALYWFNLANTLFMLQRYKQAIQSYNMVIKLNSPLTPAAHLYIAKCLRKSNQPLAAIKAMNRSKKTNKEKSFDSEIEKEKEEIALSFVEKALQQIKREKIQKSKQLLSQSLKIKETGMAYYLLFLLAKIDKEANKADYFRKKALDLGYSPGTEKKLSQSTKKHNPFWLNIDLSTGSHSNYYANNKSEPIQSSRMQKAFTSFGLEILDSQKLYWDVSYFGEFERATEIENSDYLTHTTATFLSLGAFPWVISFNPKVKFQTLAGEEQTTEQIMGLGLRFQQNNFTLGYSYENSFVRANENYSYLNATNHYSKIYLNVYKNNYVLNFNLTANEVNNSDLIYTNGTLPLSYHGTGLSVGLKYYLGENWRFNTELSGRNRLFVNKTQPTNETRSDMQSYLFFEIQYKISHSVKVYVDSTWLTTTSTMDENSFVNKNFDQATINMGLIWDILN